MTDIRKIIGVALAIAIGLLLNILACVVYKQWYPLIVVITYMFAPLPNVICGNCRRDSGALFGSEARNGWKDAGFFFTGAIVVSGLAFPAVLAHVAIIRFEAAIMAVVGGLVVYTAVLVYMHWFSDEDDGTGF